MARGLAVIGALAALWAGQAAAQAIDGRTAQRLLFAPEAEGVVFPQPGLTQAQVGAIAQAAAQQKYYGAMAFSPSEGLAARSAVLVANYHDLVAAETVALKVCNEARARSASKCVILAHVQPKGYEQRDFQLNADATRGFRVYLRGGGDKALAISRASGEWAFSKGRNAEADALAECNRLAQRKAVADCQVVVRN